MRMFRIKMTAVRTNPQQIREVRIDSEKTVGELLELVRIVYEYGDVRGSLLNEAGAIRTDYDIVWLDVAMGKRL